MESRQKILADDRHIMSILSRILKSPSESLWF